MVGQHLQHIPEIRLELITNSVESMRLIWLWRNQRSSAYETFTEGGETYDSFSKSFTWRFYQIPSLPPFFIVIDSQRIGYLRFRPCTSVHGCEISLLIDPSFRKKGYGHIALAKAEELVSCRGYTEIHAYIFETNKPSMCLFKKSGYTKTQNLQIRDLGAYSEDCVNIDKNKSSLFLYTKKLIPQTRSKKRPLFFIAEIGSNWILGSKEKNRETALKMIEIAKNAGCDAVKFQVFRADEVYAPSSGKSAYLSKNGIDSSISDILRQHEVAFEDIQFLYSFADSCGIEFMATSFSSTTFKAIDPYVKRHKIASYEITDPDLLDLAAESQKPLIMSTGGCRLPDIGWAVERLKERNPDIDLTLLQCTAQYPADPLGMNISALRTIQTAFNFPCGLSDHSSNPFVAPVMAVAMGASVIEKHITLSRNLPGPDHSFAIVPEELFECVKACRLAEEMYGNGQKDITHYEEELFTFAQRALQATEDIGVGDILQYGVNYSSLRPGLNKKGAHPKHKDYFNGKKAIFPIKSGSGLDFNCI